LPQPVRSRSCGPLHRPGSLAPGGVALPVGWMLPSGNRSGCRRGQVRGVSRLGAGRSERPMAHVRSTLADVAEACRSTLLVNPSPPTRRCASIAVAYPVHSSHCLLPSMTTSDLERRLPCRATRSRRTEPTPRVRRRREGRRNPKATAWPGPSSRRRGPPSDQTR
jgi:hypothetical protein